MPDREPVRPGEAEEMTYIVTEACIKCKYMDCVEVCPVDCFYEGENMLVIHPDECIDCGVCERHTLTQGEVLVTRDYMQSRDGRFRLYMEPDCNLVLRHFGNTSQTLWSSATSGAGANCVLRMQENGDLVIVTDGGILVWSSRTTYGELAKLEDDGDFVVYSPVQLPLWSTR